MKSYINKLFVILIVALASTGCEDRDMVVINEDFTTEVTLQTSTDVLEEDKADDLALRVEWTEPDFGYAAAAEFNVLIDLASGDFTSPQIVSAGQTLAKEFTHSELNKVLINLGAEPGTATAYKVKVDIILSKQYSRASAEGDFTMTAYSSVLDLTSPWGVVGSATPNGWDGPDVPFYKTADAGVFVAYATLKDGEWKIRQDNKWDVNYGSDANDGNLQPGGGNIPVTAGTYKITFNENDLTYAIETYSWGLVGSATPNGWDGPDTPLIYDSCSDTWRAVVKMTDGEWKIRQNNDWAVNYGDTGLDGVLEAGGDNIPVTAGYYQVIVNFNDLTYSIESTEVFGIVGSGYNDWGNGGPDAAFTPDYCNEGIYYINDVTLLDGEIKFRINNDWGTNYGDTGLDGILEEGGDNIPSVAGVYDVILDFSNPSVPTYTMTKK